ncbi:proton channel OTOP1 [Chanos chanos]|uniref:Proton channel OTOP1 n=1 Tax=Chanos chanos TaxID=29144 RepID=A0A6J2UQK5_CHACN|nr:proton channel OTOP1 [Chanos chanos]
MVEHSGLDITCLNKYCHSTSSFNSDKEKKLFTKLKVNLTESYPQKNAEVLSAQYGTNILLLGVSLMLPLSYHATAVREEHLLSFITTLMLLQLLWMVCYTIRRERHRDLRPEKDAHAGTSWIRGGLTMLALLSLIMDAFRIGYYVGFKACVSAVMGVYPVIHALHTISQVHFLWFHIKDVIKRYETFERFGVIHAVFTNLLLWCYGVMTEAEHFFNKHMKRLSDLGYQNITTENLGPPCNCTTSACTVFSTSLYYLFPFNIEYHIFVSAMLFVMWRNIGRTIDHRANRKKPTTPTTALVFGPILGLLALASTIGVLVVYSIHIEESLETRVAAISMFYCYGVVMLVAMCVAGGIGLLVYRVEGLPLDTTENPSRQLDAEVLLGSSVGAWIMSWCSIVAVVASQTNPRYRWTSLAYSLLLILEKYIQNLFIVESLYRCRLEPGERDLRAQTPPAPEIFSVGGSMVPPYNGITNQAFDGQDRCCGTLESEQSDSGQVYGCPRKHSEVPLPVVSSIMIRRSSRKREILKNITVFLFMCNISLWILPAFGCRPQFENGLEQETFGFTVWTTVLNFAIPLNLFYRMHSMASLFEVFRKV